MTTRCRYLEWLSIRQVNCACTSTRIKCLRYRVPGGPSPLSNVTLAFYTPAISIYRILRLPRHLLHSFPWAMAIQACTPPSRGKLGWSEFKVRSENGQKRRANGGDERGDKTGTSLDRFQEEQQSRLLFLCDKRPPLEKGKAGKDEGSRMQWIKSPQSIDQLDPLFPRYHALRPFQPFGEYLIKPSLHTRTNPSIASLHI